MIHADPLLVPTRLLDFESPTIAALFETRSWKALPPDARTRAIYDSSATKSSSATTAPMTFRHRRCRRTASANARPRAHC